jgi:hypothetical protein
MNDNIINMPHTHKRHGPDKVGPMECGAEQDVPVQYLIKLPPPDPQVIQLLEEWLVQARFGNVRCVLVSAVVATGGSASNWAGEATGHDLLGAAGALHARVQAAYLRAIADPNGPSSNIAG